MGVVNFNFINKMNIFFILFLFSYAYGVERETVRWCTISVAEQTKCLDFAEAITCDIRSSVPCLPNLECIQRSNHAKCMTLIDNDEADLVGLDPNEIFVGGQSHSLIPIMKEVYEFGLQQYYSVAVIKRGKLSHVQNLRDLKGTVGCFPFVSSMAGWIIPISKLIESKAMEIKDCNNIVKTASSFFREGCAANILIDKHNPLGDNDQKLCKACGSDMPGVHCTSQDIHAGYLGAVKCLAKSGDIAFVKHNTIERAIKEHTELNFKESDFELLCTDGSRASLTEFERCNWGLVPSSAIVTSSAKTFEQRKQLQNFIKSVMTKFGRNETNPTDFHLFDSYPKYGEHYDLLLSDNTKNLVEVPTSQQNFNKYLSRDVLYHIEAVRKCPVDRMRLCVTSRAEELKCLKMRIALQAQLLKPQMDCLLEETDIECMAAIESGVADIAVFEAGDIYTAGLKFNLVPIMAERYNLKTTHYYAVAVSKEDDPDTDVLYLRKRRTCHPSVMHGGGWTLPLAYLLNNELIRGYECNSIRAASEYFSKSCVPGSLHREYRQGTQRLNLCHLCHGSGSGYCSRDHSEPYYGYTGAFRCLVEGGGDIAFVKHTTVQENTDGKRKEWWARNQLTADYQLLCRDGTRAPVTEYQRCNLGKVRSNAVVTRGGYSYNATEVQTYTNLLLYAQQYYGRDSEDEWNFRLFHSDEPEADLIFQDATQRLIKLPFEQQHYHPYLGQEFLNARYRTDCTAGAYTINALPWMTFILIAVPFAHFLHLNYNL